MANTERPSHAAARLLNLLRADRYIALNFADELFQLGSIIDAQDRLALSHAAGKELDSRDETLRVFRDMAGEVYGMFFWRVSPDSKGNHSISHEAVQAVVELCEEIEQGTPAYENLHPDLASNTAPPTTSAEVGQEGEQCRAASGDAAKLLEFLSDRNNLHTYMLRGLIPVPSWRSIVDLRGEVPNGEDVQLQRIAELQEELETLRALSRGVPEGK